MTKPITSRAVKTVISALRKIWLAEEPCPGQYRRECADVTAFVNLNRMRIVIYALYALALYFLYVDMRNLGGARHDAFLYFLYVDIFLVILISLHLVLSLINKPRSADELSFLHRTLPFSFVFFILIWSVLVTVFEEETSESVITYVITIFATAALMLARIEYMAILYASSLAALAIVRMLRFTSPEGLLREYPYLVGLLIIGFVVSRIMYHSYLNQFVARRRLSDTKDELSRINSELTGTNRRLHETQMHLIRHEKLASIGQLSAGIAHEINNPLGYLKSNITTLKRRIGMTGARSPVAPDMDDIIGDIQEGLDRITNVVRSLLDFARPQSEEEIELYDIHEGIETSLQVARNSFKNPARIDKDYGEVPEIECRGSEINQVILNLITNASSAIAAAYPEGDAQGVITLRTRFDGSTVTFDISDNGTPVPETDREKIFEPFYTTKKPGDGTGLGLSVSRHIVNERHNGNLILLESGETTTFRMELPVKHTV